MKERKTLIKERDIVFDGMYMYMYTRNEMSYLRQCCTRVLKFESSNKSLSVVKYILKNQLIPEHL